MAKLLVTYHPTKTGQLKIEVEGETGEACLATLEKIFKALGRPTELTPKPEFYLISDQQNSLDLTK